MQRALTAIRRALAQDPPTPITLKGLAQAAARHAGTICVGCSGGISLSARWNASASPGWSAASGLAGAHQSADQQIANTVGFGSPYHFSHKFHQIYGIAPRGYRLSMQSGYYIGGKYGYSKSPITADRVG